MNDLAFELARAVDGEVRFDPYSRILYSTDASAYKIEPIGVVIPRHRDDVQVALEIAARHNVPVLARGGGSSLAGQAVGHAVVLDFSKYMRRIIEINPEAGWARVEPGVVCDALNAALKPHGLLFGAEPASSNRATMGGVIANNATGAHSILYGMTIDHVIDVDVFLDDGTPAHFGPLAPAELQARIQQRDRVGDLYRGLSSLLPRYEAAIRDRFPRTWRRASGYSLNYLLSPHGYTASRPSGWYSTDPYPPGHGVNLAQLMAGSEGTLAVVAEAKLNLVPRPKAAGLCVLHFESIAEACNAIPILLEFQPSAVELMDKMMIDLTRSVPGYAPKLTFIEGNPAAILIVEFYGESESHILSQIEQLEFHLRRKGLAKAMVRATTPEQQANVWGVRKVGLGLLQSIRGDARPTAFMEDVAVPVERLGDYVRTVEELFRDHGVESGYYAHASAGCLHIRPVISLKTAEGIAKMKAMSGAVLDVVIAMGGAMSGEHGDGLSRSMWNGKLFGPQVYEAFCELKRLFDPGRRLNPGKIVDAPDLTENLRFGAEYSTIAVSTHLSFASEGGLAAAVEQCNGMGACRKAEGTMCPSYMATREEEHSTRGRANALRAALSGRLPPAELTSRRMYDVLDLCLECKACKAECPSGVDMAKIKYEFLAQYQAVNGVPVRSRLFTNIHALSRLACSVAPLANGVLSFPAARWLNEKLLGITRHQRLPAFAHQTFRQWYFDSRPLPILEDPRSEAKGANPQPLTPASVVLFVDTFTNFNHPEIGIAAVRLLKAAGYEVLLADHACCGRPMISKGLLEDAKRSAARNVEALGMYAERGFPIIGLEPSCLLTLRDEYLDLLPHDPRAQRVAEQAMMIEEFLARLSAEGRLRIRWRNEKRRVLVHGHCYQKALTGTGHLLTLLRLPGWEVSEIEAGCCGMAGSFGYEAEHYAISQKIGEDRLFPAVRAASEETVIAASGMSCRHQIRHGTGRRAKHPVELLAEAIAT